MQFFRPFIQIIGCCSLVAAIIALSASIFSYWHTQKFVDSAQRTKGAVSALTQKPGDNCYYPIFVFEDAQGNKHHVESLSGSNPAAYSVGDSVTVLYEADKPDNAEIDTFLNVWIWPVAFAGFGVLNLLFGLGLIVFAVLRKQ